MDIKQPKTQKISAPEKSHESYISMDFLMGANMVRCGKLLEYTENDYIKGLEN